MRELIPLKQGPESREAMQEEGFQPCGCGAEEHPIIISDEEVTMVEIIISIWIQVEHPMPEDCVMSD